MLEKYFASDDKLFFVTRSEISSKSDPIYLAVTQELTTSQTQCLIIYLNHILKGIEMFPIKIED